MINRADERAIIRTLLLYGIAFVVFLFGINIYHTIPIIKEIPQISAVLSLALVVAISLTGISTEICFLLCGIIGAYIMGLPLNQYGEYLWKNAGSMSIFMIALCGGVIALLARGDLVDQLNRTDPYKNPDQYTDIKHQVDIFCLFYKLQTFIKRMEKRSKLLAALVFFIQNLMLFVSSVVSAKTFSAMLNTGEDMPKGKKDYRHAGILCMCVSGCLLVFFYLKSPWWLFFLGFAEKQNVGLKFPVATLVYGIFSFVHGYYLLSKSKTGMEVEKINLKTEKHPMSMRHSIIYMGLIVVFLSFTLPSPISAIIHAKNNGGTINLSIITILLLMIAAILIATILTRKIMTRTLYSTEKSNVLNRLRLLMVGDLKSGSGIKAVMGTLILIITILAFRDMINTCIPGTDINHATQVMQEGSKEILSAEGITALLCCFGVLLIASGIGYVLGSNFGSFSIGLIIFNIVAAKITVLGGPFWRRWMLECLIVVSTFWNQVSPVSSNVPAAVTDNDCDIKKVSKEAWKVKSFWDKSAFAIQVVAVLVCIFISGMLTYLKIW